MSRGSLIAFVGPTLTARECRRHSGIGFRPPVEDGDVFRAVAGGIAAIGIVDGYFENRPAIRHKEILWAIAKGVRVYGASSMGALRAAELHPFGMIGVGEVFEAYRSGRLESDDAVAVAHGPAELGYTAVSVALVDIEASVEQAREQRAVSEEEAEAVVAAARAAFFKDRTWPAIGRALGDFGIVRARQREITAILQDGGISVKRRDAQAMLDRMLRDAARPYQPPVFDLPKTPAFRRARCRALDQRGRH